MKPIKLVVTRGHRSEYPRPIAFPAGASLCVGEKYAGAEGWEDWYLCSVPGQEPGWVPGQVIEWTGDGRGVAKEAYTARELDVDRGEALTGFRVLNGWVWCARHGGTEEGWVPLECVREAGDGARGDL